MTAEAANSSLEARPDPSLIEPLRHPSPVAREALGGSIAGRPFTACHVSDRYGDFSPLRDITIGGFCDYFLLEHCEQRSKEESGTIYADVHGQRKDRCALSVSALVFDIDGAKSYDAIRAQRERAGHAGASWTTFGSGQTITHISASTAIDWRCGKQPIDPRTAFTQQQIHDYCHENESLSHLTNVRLGNDGTWKVIDGKHVLTIEHDLVEKVRDLFFIEPISLAETGIDGFKALYRAVGNSLYGEGVYDPSCCNPSRIFWNPAHPMGADWELDLYGGTLYPWRDTWDQLKVDVDKRRLDNEGRAEQRLRAPAPDLVQIAHALDSIPASVGRKDWFACIGAIFHETNGNEQGRQLAHDWSARDQRQYDPEDLDNNVWRWFEHASGTKYTMGTLIFLARKHDANFRPLPTAECCKDLQMAVWGSYDKSVQS